jgi:HNH endonuclease
MDETLARAVRERAGHACEYCRMPQAFYPTVTFPIDHVIARQHRGPTTLGNLALSCLH